MIVQINDIAINIGYFKINNLDFIKNLIKFLKIKFNKSQDPILITI